MGDQDHDESSTGREARPNVMPVPRGFRNTEPMEPMRDARRFSPLAIALVTLVVVVALAFGVLAWLAHSRAQAAAERALRNTPNALQQSLIEGQKLQREAEDRDAARRARLEQQEAAKLQASADRQRAEDESRRAEAAAAARKAKAWEKFYRKPAACNDAATMECANAYIRAQRAFEEKYARGEL